MTKIAGSGSISQKHGSADPAKMSWIRNTGFYSSFPTLIVNRSFLKKYSFLLLSHLLHFCYHMITLRVVGLLLPEHSLERIVACSVADPGCLSRILFFTHPGFRIPDPKTATKERGEKKIVVITFYLATNFTKLQIILVLKC